MPFNKMPVAIMGKKKRLTLPAISEDQTLADIANIFANVQGNSTCHEKCIKLLQGIYNKTEHEVFKDQFLKCLEVPLQIGEKNLKVEFTLEFAAKFCATFSGSPAAETPDSDEDRMHPFLLSVFNYALKYQSNELHGVRFRMCQFINKILVCMGEQAELDDQLCDDILNAMLTRLQDLKYKVRTQAVIALHRLQNPSDPKDAVTKSYLFHLECDPSAPVRRAVICKLARTACAFTPVINRIRDIDEKVRREAFHFIASYSSKSFKIKQRIQIIKNGLNDRSDHVKKCVSEILLPKWLVHFDRSYFELIKAITLDATVADIKQSVEVAEMILTVFLNSTPSREMLEVLPLDNTKVISNDLIKHETVTYWRCLVKHFYKKGTPEEQDLLDEIIPELSYFCSTVQSFVYSQRTVPRDQWQEYMHQSTLGQLFDMMNCFDLSDEVGRNNLLQLIMSLLDKEKLSSDVIRTMVQLLAKLITDPKQRILQLVELISDITEPMQRQEVEMTESEAARNKVKIHEIRFEINLLTSDMEDLIAEKQLFVAAELNEKISDLHKKLAELQAPMPVEEVKERTDDASRIHKALDIVIAMLESESIRKFIPELRVLQENLITDLCTQSSVAPDIEAKALRCLALFALLDETLANDVMPKLFVRLMSYKFHASFNDEVLLVSLAAIIDLLLFYGLNKYPEAEETVTGRTNRTKRTLYDNSQAADDDDDDEEEEILLPQGNAPVVLPSGSNELVSTILSFIDEDNVKIRTLAADGLCRLLLSEKLKSVEVLTRLIILWFNPATENDTEMRQIIGCTLIHFAQNTSGAAEQFQSAFLPVLNMILNAPINSPLSSIDLDAILNLLLTYTQPGFSNVDNTNVHNQLAIMICEEILKETGECGHYIRALPHLKICDDDISLKNDLHNLCSKIIANMKNKAYIRCVQRFDQKILGNHSLASDTGVANSIATENNETRSETVASVRISSTRKTINRKSLTPPQEITRTPKRSIRKPSRFEQLKDNEDNASICSSSGSETRRSSRRRNSRLSRTPVKNVIVSSSSESEQEQKMRQQSGTSPSSSVDTSSDDLDKPNLPPIRRRSGRAVKAPSKLDL